MPAGTGGMITLINPEDTASEVSRYVSPVLVRVRGFILIDFDVDLTAATNNAQVMAGLFVEDSDTGLANNVAASLSRDSCIWFDMCGLSNDNIAVSGTESNDTVQSVAFAHAKLTIDTKAKRRLEDTKKLILVLTNMSDPAGAVDITYTYGIRTLLVE